jgi:hypothetical protein
VIERAFSPWVICGIQEVLKQLHGFSTPPEFERLSEAAPFLKTRADAVAFSRMFQIRDVPDFLEAEGDSAEGAKRIPARLMQSDP